MEGSASFFNLLDYVYIGLMGASSLFGMSNGFTKTVLSLCTWIGSGFLATQITPDVYDFVKPYISSPSIAQMVSVAVAYISCLVLLTVISRFISDMVKKSMFSGLDRALGLLFGLLRGLCFPLLVAAVLLIFGIQNKKYEILDRSQIATLAYSELNGTVPRLVSNEDLEKLKTKTSPKPLRHNFQKSFRELKMKLF